MLANMEATPPMKPSRKYVRTARAAIAATTAFLLSACQPYGCQPGFSTPSDSARDLAAFNQALASHPAFKGLKATAVHGHEVDVVDTNVREDAPIVDEGIHRTVKYNRVGGISDKLRDTWSAIFASLHPNAFNRDIVNIQVIDAQGRTVIFISVPQCVMP